MALPIRLAELAEALGREVCGDGEVLVSGVAALESAGPGDLVFVRSARYRARLEESAAGAVILPRELAAGGRPAILSPNPNLDFARAAALLCAAPEAPPHVSGAAFIAPDAKVDATATVGPGCSIGARARIGAGSVLHAQVSVYPDVQIGRECTLHAGVVIREGSLIGDRVVLQPGVVLGGDGFGFVPDEQGRWVAVPHLGRVVLEDDVEVGANSTVDRGTLGETRIRRGAKLDNLVQVAHNCVIGEDALIVAQTGLSGHTEIGRGAIVMAQAGSAGHLRVGERAFVGARAGLHKDVPAGARVWGSPQMEERSWHRAVRALARLPDALRRLRALERAVGLRPARNRDGD